MWKMIKGYWSIVMANVCGLFAVRLFKIDWNLYQSGHLKGLWSWYALKFRGIKGVVDLEGGLDRKKVRKYLTWYHHWPIVDGPLPDVQKLHRVARLIMDQTVVGMKVLVHCSAGVNRSSLVNGCVLYLRGRRGEKIVQMIREGRPGALTNDVFVEFLVLMAR